MEKDLEMKTATPEVSVMMKAQAVVGTARSGCNESIQGRFFGGDDI